METRLPLLSFMRPSRYWTRLDAGFDALHAAQSPRELRELFMFDKDFNSNRPSNKWQQLIEFTLPLQLRHVGGSRHPCLHMHAVHLLCGRGFNTSVASQNSSELLRCESQGVCAAQVCIQKHGGSTQSWLTYQWRTRRLCHSYIWIQLYLQRLYCKPRAGPGPAIPLHGSENH